MRPSLSSCPDLFRASNRAARQMAESLLDCRDKPGNDEEEPGETASPCLYDTRDHVFAKCVARSASTR